MGATAVLLCLMAWSSAAGALPQVGGAGTGAAAAAAPLRLVPADSASSRRQPFTIEDDRLILDGKPIQIIAGRCGAGLGSGMRRRSWWGGWQPRGQASLLPWPTRPALPCHASHPPAGSMHYFRMLPEYWADRLARAKAMGINTVEVRGGG